MLEAGWYAEVKLVRAQGSASLRDQYTEPEFRWDQIGVGRQSRLWIVLICGAIEAPTTAIITYPATEKNMTSEIRQTNSREKQQ